MKRNLITIFALFFYFSVSIKVDGQTIDSVACKKFEDTLRIIEKFVDDNNSDPHLERIDAISLLTKLTNTPYEGPVTFIGTEFPKKSYYIKCRDWYIANKRKLRWDDNKKEIFVKGE